MTLRRATTALADLAAQLPLDPSAWWRWDGEPVKSAEELAAAANIPVLEAKARWVRTAAGAEHYGQPIGTQIVADAVWMPDDLDSSDRHLEDVFGEPVLRESGQRKPGTSIKVGRHTRLVKPRAGEAETPARYTVDDYGDGEDLFPKRDVAEEPITHVYRAMALSEWNQAVERGYIQSDMRGVIADWEGTNAALESASARSYIPGEGEPAVIVRLRVDPEDEWFAIQADDYLRTRRPIPLDRIEAMSAPMRMEVDPESRYGRRRLERMEQKSLRRVRTWEGSRFYELPVGALIRPGQERAKGRGLRRTELLGPHKGRRDTGKPRVLSTREFQEAPGAELFRGVGSDKGAAISMRGELGSGDYGQGIYFATDGIALAAGYANKSPTGRVLRAKVSPGAKLMQAPQGLGSADLERWSDSHGLDGYYTGPAALVIRNPAVLTYDARLLDSAEAVIVDLRRAGYDTYMPEGQKYVDAARRLDEIGYKDARYVRTIEGSRFYNQPIGTLITPDREAPAMPTIRLSPPPRGAEFEELPADQQGQSGDERYPGTPYWGRYGAAGVAMRTAGMVMLVQRGPANSRAGLWQLPGGALNENEDPYQGSARELREETGFTSAHWLTPVGEFEFNDPSGWRYTTLVADIPVDEANTFWPVVDGKEISQAKWFSPAQIQQLIEAGELVPELAATILPLLEQAQEMSFTSSAASVKAGDFRGLTRIGPRKGSHSGGLFEAADGSKWYIKTAPSQEHAASEVLANELYLMAEVRVPRMTLGQDGKGVPELGDRPQVASEWLEHSEAVFKSQLTETHEDGYQAKLREDFAADVWLANWDVAGMGFSNVVISSVGMPYRVDQGGALAWRALGESKGDLFGPEAHEWQTLRDPSRSPDASVIFGGMNLEDLRWSVSRLDYLTEEGIRETVIRHGFNDTMADVLIARKYDIQRRLKAEIEAAKLIRPTRRERGESWQEKVEGAATEQAALRAVPISLQNEGSFKLIQANTEVQRRAKFAVNQYSANEYDNINLGLREGIDRHIDPDLPEERQQYIRYGREAAARSVDDIDLAMSYSALDRDVVVWRGLAINKMVGAGPADVPGDLTGFTWTDPAYTSTSAGKATADRFARDRDGTQAVMEIIVPAGVHALRLSDWGDEAELLLERGLTFRVVEDRGEDPYGIRLLRVEVVAE